MSSVTISKNKTDFPANHVTDDRRVTPKCQFCNSESHDFWRAVPHGPSPQVPEMPWEMHRLDFS